MWDKIAANVSNIFCHFVTTWIFKGNKVKFSSFVTRGIPYVMVARNARGLVIGKGFTMNNGISHNPIGCPQPCTFFVDTNAQIRIGENVGISQTALVAHADIEIMNNVKIGGGSYIYTTDFHSLDPVVRASENDQKERLQRPVRIDNGVFIGAHCIILKGVTIGENSIIGAGSVVTKSIPANQIWGGNPAKFIRNI